MITLAALIAGLAIGGLIGYGLHHWLFLQERKNMANDWLDIAHSHETLATRLKQDDTRLGINTGINFAVDTMANTLDEIKEHVDQQTK